MNVYDCIKFTIWTLVTIVVQKIFLEHILIACFQSDQRNWKRMFFSTEQTSKSLPIFPLLHLVIYSLFNLCCGFIVQTMFSKFTDYSKNVKNNSVVDNISNDILILIISFNIDDDAIKTLINLKTLSKQFYNALNPNNGAVNMIWKEICRIKFPNTPQTLKVKRWDQFLKYRMIKINQRKNIDEDFKVFSDEYPSDSVIINCTQDIEEINNNLYSDDNDNDIFKDEIGDHFLPKGYEWKLKCPVLSDKLKKIDANTRYCQVCKKNVYTVHTERDLKKRVENGQCVSMTIYWETCYKRKKGKMRSRSRARRRKKKKNWDVVEIDRYKETRWY